MLVVHTAEDMCPERVASEVNNNDEDIDADDDDEADEASNGRVNTSVIPNNVLPQLNQSLYVHTFNIDGCRGFDQAVSLYYLPLSWAH